MGPMTRRALARASLAAIPFIASRAGATPLAPRSVPTLTGPVSCDRLGTTLMHEHVLSFVSPRLDGQNFTPIPDALRGETVAFAASLLKDAARVGIRTLVDMTPQRPIDLYKEIASRTEVRIVVSTGFYRHAKVPPVLAAIEDEKLMEQRMLGEVLEGIDGSGIRAGVIKIASEGSPLTLWEKKVFRAAARVQRATKTPICTHLGGSAREQLDLLVGTGADPRRIMLSHSDMGGPTREKLRDTLISVAREGAYLEVDTFGQDFYTPWADLVFHLRSLCDAGLANRIFVSVDCNWRWEDGKKVFEGAEPPNSDPYAADRTYAYMITDAVPKLLKSGFSKREVDTFLVDNPRRFFLGE